MTRMTRVTLAAVVALATAVPGAAAASAASAASAAGGAQSRATGIPAAQRPQPRTVTSEQARAGQIAQGLGLDSREGLVVTAVLNDPDGSSHVRYARSFAGLRVIGGDFVLHQDAAGIPRSTSWNRDGAVAVASTTPTLTLAAARGSVQRQRGTAPQRGELVVFTTEQGPVLAYDMVTEGVQADGQTPSRLHSIVDARSGAVLQSWEDIKDGTGAGIYVGTVSIGTTLVSGSYQLRDAAGNSTTDLNGATSGTVTLFTDGDDTCRSGPPSLRLSAAVDAQYGAEKTFDYYSTQLGRAGIWNNGVGARSRVHYGSNYVNAFWDGTQMTYGDGSGNTHPLTELDVAGHEMSHGVTENTANLTYSGESGGLNEATSDIFGTAVEWYAANPVDVPDYLIGEMININGNGTPLRYMDKPSKDGASRDCWSSTLGSLNVHYSSGPLNHWYYLVSEGSGAKTINGVAYNSTTCNGSSMTGIGHLKAEKVWYRALSVYLTSSSKYAAAREASIKAAKDLYGVGSAECTAVANGFSAINVAAGAENCANTPPPPPTGNLLLNPGFESGATSWTGTTGVITSSTSRPAHTGSWKAWLGGNGTTSSENVQQTVSIPATATAATLSFWLRIDTSETGSAVYDRLRPQIISGGTTTTLATYSNVGANATWSLKTFDVTAYKGKTITVKFNETEDVSLQTSFVVDDVTLATS